MFSLIFSSLTIFNEFTTFVFQLTGKRCSPLSWAYFMNASNFLRVLFGSVSLMYVWFLFHHNRYISICFFYGFFNLPIPFLRVYDLYPHYTDVYALGASAYSLCRYQFSLFYHYFTLFQVCFIWWFDCSFRDHRMMRLLCQ